MTAMPENRRHPQVELSTEAITRHLAPLLPGKSLRSVTLLTEGLCNTNYRIAIEGLRDELVLRLYVREPGAIALEQAVYFHVGRHAGSELPMPEMLYADLTGGPSGHPYAISRFVEGPTMRAVLKAEKPDADAIAREAGRALARLDTISFPRAGRLGADWKVEPWPWQSDDNDACTGYILQKLNHPKVRARLGEARRERLLRFIDDNRHYLTAIAGRARLVHGDFNRSNVLFRQEGGRWRVAALLDWEWAHAGSPLMDIGNMLRDISYLAPTFEASFIAGYREGEGWLPEPWKKISRYLDISNHCEFLENREEGNEFLPACLRWIDKTIDHWETCDLR